jgi:drug/metabolite transporter (DMT)-like permease
LHSLSSIVALEHGGKIDATPRLLSYVFLSWGALFEGKAQVLKLGDCLRICMSTHPQSQKELMGFAYGFLGVVVFSLTLPATRVAVSGFDPVFVGLGRAIIASGLSLILLVVTRQKFPPWRSLPRFCIVVIGVVIGFPLLSAIAMRDAPASYGAVITGLLPLASALCGVWRAGEGLSLGGIARVGQIQLLQPFLTILASAVFLGEHLSITTLSFAVGVIVCVALGKQTQISTT